VASGFDANKNYRASFMPTNLSEESKPRPVQTQNPRKEKKTIKLKNNKFSTSQTTIKNIFSESIASLHQQFPTVKMGKLTPKDATLQLNI